MSFRPLGAVTAIILLLFFRPANRSTTALPFNEKLKHLDLPGLLLFIPAVIMLLLAMQWGGNTHAWRSATIIGLIIGFALMISFFIVWQWHQKEEASIPFRIFGQRNVYSAAAMVFFGLGSVGYVTMLGGFLGCLFFLGDIRSPVIFTNKAQASEFLFTSMVSSHPQQHSRSEWYSFATICLGKFCF